ncbi:MAG TPA: shikimate kinase [Candidatus Tumulicola sp.]
MKRHVALVGFMTSGKSSVGQRLARRLNCAFYDTDALVERSRGTIAEIFANEGEAAFRRYEMEALAKALQPKTPAVVSLGGGTLGAPENRDLLEEHAYRVFVRLSPRRAYERLRRSRVSRPLLGAAPTWESVEELYARRLPHYAAAEYIVDADDVATPRIVDIIVEWIRERKIAI